jgi:hypothetical protein
MTIEQDLTDLERAGWDALSTEGGAAAFYGEVLAREVLVLLPGGMVITDREAVVASMGGAPWSSYELGETWVVPLGGDAAVIAYRVNASREGSTYDALIASTYLREAGAWRLAVHQQTPV